MILKYGIAIKLGLVNSLQEDEGAHTGRGDGGRRLGDGRPDPGHDQEGVCRLHCFDHRPQTQHHPRLRPNHGAGPGTHQGVRLASGVAGGQELDISLHGEGCQSRLIIWPRPKFIRLA